MEMQGLLLRGAFEYSATPDSSTKNPDLEIEWCERRILQRIHRRTVATLRKQVEPVPPAVYMRWLLQWQHLAPQTQLTGEEGVFEALRQLEGFEAPAIEWERTLLPARVANYDPGWLDALCLSGAVGWGRISPHPAWFSGNQPNGDDTARPRRVIPTNAAPITFYIRETADWLPHALTQQCVEEEKLAAALSPHALQLRALLQQRGACFANDIQRIANLTRHQTQHALWELATAGLAAADGFDQLRACMDPRRRSTTTETPNKRPTRSSAGRWSLLNEPAQSTNPGAPGLDSETWVGAAKNSKEAQSQLAKQAIEQARRTDAALESFARQLLARYGILFRDLLTRESNAPRWRDLLNILRRLEARGEIRGGRFLSGFGGEQYALPEAVESLRAARTRDCSTIISVSAADPMNLAGIVIPGDRVPAVPGKQVLYRNGSLHSEQGPDSISTDKITVTLPPTLLPATAPPTLRLF
jgi:ATP-dependent Lhr-like helicase